MNNRRHSPRIPASWPASLQVDDECIVGRTADVSAYGIFVVTAPTTALKVGCSYRVELMAHMGEKLVILAEVRHVSGKGVGMQMTVRLPV